MKLSTLPSILLCLAFSGSNAFQSNLQERVLNTAATASVSTRTTRRLKTALWSLPTAVAARDNLLETAERLKKLDGILLVDSTSKSTLQEAVKELEAVSHHPAVDDFETDLLGDWTLLCSTASNAGGLDLSKIPFLSMSPLKNFSDLLKRSLVVKQRVRSIAENGKVDRIDHVLQYQPPDSIKEILDDVPEFLEKLNINPLHVTEGKLTLVHKASVESVDNTKLSLESIIFSVAGNSQYLDGAGADLLGINLPFGEFLNAGSFETTYMDDEIRISRGKLGLVEQLRVFVRSDFEEEAEALIADEEEEEGVTDVEIVATDTELESLEEDDSAIEAPSDVEDDEADAPSEPEVDDESAPSDVEDESGPPEEAADI